MNIVYLDHISATPLAPSVVAGMRPYFSDLYGNPQSRHRFGGAAREAVEMARSRVGQLIGAETDEIIFTASGTEANNLAIKGIIAAQQGREDQNGRPTKRHLITSAIEHFSVAYPFRRLEQSGWEITWLPVGPTGRVDPEQVARAIRNDTLLVSIMHANNEIGTVQEIASIGAITQKAGVLFHIDMVATAGVLSLNVETLGSDMAGFSAQGFYGPKGAGALYVRRGTRLYPLVEGGIQEEGRRGGVENVAAIVGMGIAAEEICHELVSNHARMTKLRDKLIEGLLQIPFVHCTGDRKMRLPNIASFVVEYLDGEALVRNLERRGIIATSGSSCSAHALKISPVLTALGLPGNMAQGAIVFSLGRTTSEDQIDYLLAIFPEMVEAMRKVSPIYHHIKGAGLK